MNKNVDYDYEGNTGALGGVMSDSQTARSSVKRLKPMESKVHELGDYGSEDVD